MFTRHASFDSLYFYISTLEGVMRIIWAFIDDYFLKNVILEIYFYYLIVPSNVYYLRELCTTDIFLRSTNESH